MVSTWLSTTTASTWLTLILAGTLATTMAACHGADPAAPAPGQEATTSTATRTPASNPLLAADQADNGQRLHGQITEKLPAGGYTYLELELASGERTWVVLMSSETPEPGDALAVIAMGSRSDFHSRRLDRRFDHLVFASLDRGSDRGDQKTN